VVWNEQQEREYIDEGGISFRSNLKKDDIAKAIIEESIDMYYAERDYPDFIRLVDWVLNKISKDSNIIDMPLLDVMCSKRYRNNYIRLIRTCLKAKMNMIRRTTARV
jgi:hypothetical protein